MKHKDFTALTKKQKLQLEPIDAWTTITGITKALFIPIPRKNDGYGMSAMFIETNDGEWNRVMDYDCFRFINPGPYRLRGDFEHNGVVFFLGDGEEWSLEYGGEFTRKVNPTD